MDKYWFIAGFGLVLLAISLFSAYKMYHTKGWSHRISVHLAFFASTAGLMLLLGNNINRLITARKIPFIKTSLVNDLTILGISLLAIQQVFQLIDRMTHDQVRKGSDRTSATSIARILKLGICLVFVLLFGEHLGISLTGLLAVGGFGGIAIGIAGQNVLSNMFSGVMLYFDRPFRLGDWISSPDRQIEGTVEEVGWRMTRITTFDHRPLSVPNSLFSSIIVETPGQMTNRRINTTLALRYEDSARVGDIVTDIRTMLKTDTRIDQSSDILVYFNEFGTSSLNIMVYCFTRTTRWAEWLGIQQDIYLRLIDIVHENGADLALPTQALHMKPEEESADERPAAAPAEVRP